MSDPVSAPAGRMRAALGALPPAWRRRLRPVAQWARYRRSGSYANEGEEQVIGRLLAGVGAPRYCVDIGAGDGRTMSNTLALHEQGWPGLSVEVDPESFRALAARHARFARSTLLRGRVTPDNVATVLAAAGVPADFAFLSVDIDGYDHFVLDALLALYRPALVCAEINEKVPPPLRFTVDYDPDYTWDGTHFYGQSICQLALLCARHRYAIVELEYNNCFLMPEALAPRSLDPALAYRTGYAERPDRLVRFPWNADMEPLLGLDPPAAAAFLEAAFARHRGRYTLSY